MNSDTASCTEPHYHIRWLSSGRLDWERHDTHAKADESAKELRIGDEGYEIEEFDETCEICRRSVQV